MRKEQMLGNMVKYHTQMVEKLKNVDLGKLSKKQVSSLEKALEELEGYTLVHVRTEKK